MSHETFPKFIIENNVLIIGKVIYHKQLVVDKEKVQGGGWWRFINDKTGIVLYGDSHDFGKAKEEDIKKCIIEGNVLFNRRRSIIDNYDFYYDTQCELIDLKT